MKATIKFIKTNTISFPNILVLILDENNKIIYKTETNELGIIKFYCKKNKVYKIYILSQNYIIYTNTNIINIYIRQIFITPLRILRLTDYYYEGLPIEKGNIILCQNK